MKSSLGEWKDIVHEEDPIEPLVQAAMDATIDRTQTVMQLRETFRRYFSAAYMQGKLSNNVVPPKEETL